METVMRRAVLVAVVCGAVEGWAFSGGAPGCEISNSTMSSQMGPTTLVSPDGWSLTTTGTSYLPGQTVTLSLSKAGSNSTFKGLLLWSKSASGAFVGSFATPSGFGSMAGCSLSTLTHTTAVAKPQRSFTWTAPGAGAGAVTFRAFVVVSSRNAWVELTPLTLTEGSTGTGGGAAGGSSGGGTAGGSAGGAAGGSSGGAAGGSSGGAAGGSSGGAAGGSSGGAAGGSSGGAAGGTAGAGTAGGMVAGGMAGAGTAGGSVAGGSSGAGGGMSGGTAGGSSAAGGSSGGSAGGAAGGMAAAGGASGGSSATAGGRAGGTAGGTAGGGTMEPTGCGCSTQSPSALWPLLLALSAGLARRRPGKNRAAR